MNRLAWKEEKAERKRAKKEAEERGKEPGTPETAVEHGSAAAPPEA